MLLNIQPLRKYPDYRKLYIGQMISFLGSMVSYVAIPYQIYDLTKSSFVVGLLGAAQLIPVLVFSLLGGSVADSMDRKKLIIISEIIMSLCALVLVLNTQVSSPQVWIIFVCAAVMQAANGFHRPAMQAMTQKMVDPIDFPALSALSSLQGTFGAVAGPALGGLLLAAGGINLAYAFDLVTFVIAVISVSLIKKVPSPENKKKAGIGSILEGLRYAWARPELMGTYIVDIVAMLFAFPMALFPAMGVAWGGAQETGYLYSAMPLGSLFVTLFSGWSGKIKRHGAMVVLAATFWGIAIIVLGYAPNIWLAIAALALAGAADMVSALFRQVIWNETIPNEIRGRMAGIEMISYMTGPLIGNARIGWMASVSGNQIAIVSGGILCIAGVVTCGFLLPAFWNYRSRI